MGAHEIEKKLGKVAVAEIETKEFEKAASGLPLLTSETESLNLVSREIKGFLGAGKEEITMPCFVWIPCYLFQIGRTKSEGIVRKKLTTTPIWNIYEALDGLCLYSLPKKPPIGNITMENILQSKIKDRKITNQLIKTFEKAREVVTPRAKQRYIRKLAEAGIHMPVDNISVNNITEIYYPFFMAILKKGGKERVIAVDCFAGRISKNISDVLTRNLSYVVQNLVK